MADLTLQDAIERLSVDCVVSTTTVEFQLILAAAKGSAADRKRAEKAERELKHRPRLSDILCD